ncbi:hypothetical protein C8J57DRAFT_1264330 [Mycena rebaudengoi]|nr:hypothetical protein C8J57DRAFT_1264330 [Mycena rebaudengoi]
MPEADKERPREAEEELDVHGTGGNVRRYRFSLRRSACSRSRGSPRNAMHSMHVAPTSRVALRASGRQVVRRPRSRRLSPMRRWGRTQEGVIRPRNCTRLTVAWGGMRRRRFYVGARPPVETELERFDPSHAAHHGAQDARIRGSRQAESCLGRRRRGAGLMSSIERGNGWVKWKMAKIHYVTILVCVPAAVLRVRRNRDPLPTSATTQLLAREADEERGTNAYEEADARADKLARDSDDEDSEKMPE